MIDKRIMFDERYDSEEYETTTLYFTAPKELLKVFLPKNDYPEAISMEISIEFSTEHIDSAYANVCVSPTREVEHGTEDYDWYDIDLPYDEIGEIIELANL